MKKILVTFLATALLFAAPVSVFAETPANEQTLQTSTAADLEGSIKLEATVVSSYTLKFPLKVDVAQESVTVDIFAKGDVDGAKKIIISKKNDSNSLVNSDKSLTMDVGVAFGSGILGTDITSEYSNAKETMTITHETLSAGYWAYDLPILIQLV